MQTQINAFLETKVGGMVIKIFGYSTKAVPGLEIHGLGKYGQLIKQKFIYITRERGIKVPAKKFVVCLEQNDLTKNLELDDVRWLEFPLLLVYWYLAEIIPIKTLEDCLCSGHVNTAGRIVHHDCHEHIEKYLKDLGHTDLKLISISKKSFEEYFLIETEQLLKDIPALKFS